MSQTDIATAYPAIRLGPRGRLVLPAKVRRELGLEPGSLLNVTLEEPGVLKLTSAEIAASDCMGLLEYEALGRSLADELVAERHEAAKRE